MTAQRSTGVTPGTGRRRPVLAGVALGVAVLAVAGTGWVRATATSAIDPAVPVTVTGAAVAPAVSAGGLVVLAAAAALTLGGRWGRRLAAGGVALGGALVVAGSVGALAEPGRAARAAAQAAVGVDVLGAPATLTAMPWLALVLGASAVVLGLWTVVVADGWSDAPRRHEGGGGPEVRASPAAAGLQEHDAWDALSRGDDPT